MNEEENKKLNYDLFSRDFKASPFGTYAEMRQEVPIYLHEAPDGRRIWYVTRYVDVVAVLKDGRFVKDPRHALPADKLANSYGKRSVHQRINENMLFSDPPDHTRLRALVSQAFTPRRMAATEPRIRATATALLDKVAAQGKMDLIADYALPLPVAVISELLGIPKADEAKVADWSQAIISPGGKRLGYGERKRRMRQFVAYLRALFAERQQQPQDDLTTALVQAEEAGEKLSSEELSSMVALLLVTGHETTVNLIGNGVLALLRHPEQLRLLRERPSLIDSAIEELLRFDGPVETSTTRWVGEDLMFQGHAMRKGDVMRVVIASANRDAAQFVEPDRLDISREKNQHLAFGQGIHYCLGAPLARLEGKVAIPLLFERFPNLRLAIPVEDLHWRKGVLFRGLEGLPVSWGG